MAARGGPALRIVAALTPEDLVGEAIASLLLGEADPIRGRRLSARARQDATVFLWSVMAIINSLLNNLVTSKEAAALHQPTGPDTDDEAAGLIDPVDHDRLLQNRDLKRVLFQRLRRILPKEPSLEPVIDHWEKTFHDGDRIADGGHGSNLVRRVRKHARGILDELARELPKPAPTGMDMLL